MRRHRRPRPGPSGPICTQNLCLHWQTHSTKTLRNTPQGPGSAVLGETSVVLGTPHSAGIDRRGGNMANPAGVKNGRTHKFADPPVFCKPQHLSLLQKMPRGGQNRPSWIFGGPQGFSEIGPAPPKFIFRIFRKTARPSPKSSFRISSRPPGFQKSGRAHQNRVFGISSTPPGFSKTHHRRQNSLPGIFVSPRVFQKTPRRHQNRVFGISSTPPGFSKTPPSAKFTSGNFQPAGISENAPVSPKSSFRNFPHTAGFFKNAPPSAKFTSGNFRQPAGISENAPASPKSSFRNFLHTAGFFKNAPPSPISFSGFFMAPRVFEEMDRPSPKSTKFPAARGLFKKPHPRPDLRQNAPTDPGPISGKTRRPTSGKDARKQGRRHPPEQHEHPTPSRRPALTEADRNQPAQDQQPTQDQQDAPPSRTSPKASETWRPWPAGWESRPSAPATATGRAPRPAGTGSGTFPSAPTKVTLGFNTGDELTLDWTSSSGKRIG